MLASAAAQASSAALLPLVAFFFVFGSLLDDDADADGVDDADACPLSEESSERASARRTLLTSVFVSVSVRAPAE